MSCEKETVEIKRLSDGEIVSFETEYGGRWTTDYGDDERYEPFMWQEHNYACDCNRHDFFERAAGRDPSDEDALCSHNRYLVRITSRGQVVYDEITGPEKPIWWDGPI